MTNRDKMRANEQREWLFECAQWCSVVSGRPLREGVPQLAHRVARTKAAIAKWGTEVIDHPLNLVPVCNLRENDRCNIGNQPIPARDLLARIVRITTGRESMPNLADYYAELRAEFAQN